MVNFTFFLMAYTCKLVQNDKRESLIMSELNKNAVYGHP